MTDNCKKTEQQNEHEYKVWTNCARCKEWVLDKQKRQYSSENYITMIYLIEWNKIDTSN